MNPETKTTISYDDFAKLDIRVGTVVSVEKVLDADRLLRLMVDIGGEKPYQIISGITQFIEDPQTLVGRQVPILSNLEPRTIRGFVSEGMMLAAGDGNAFALLHPSQSLSPGSIVK